MVRPLLTLVMTLAIAAALSAQTATTDKTAKSSHSKSGTITGCLSGPNDEGAYVLKNAAGRSIEVGGTDDLKAHVGHEVKLNGTWAKSGAEIGEREENEAAEHNEKHEAGEAAEHHERRERHFKVSNITMVADSCSAPGKK